MGGNRAMDPNGRPSAAGLLMDDDQRHQDDRQGAGDVNRGVHHRGDERAAASVASVSAHLVGGVLEVGHDGADGKSARIPKPVVLGRVAAIVPNQLLAPVEGARRLLSPGSDRSKAYAAAIRAWNTATMFLFEALIATRAVACSRTPQCTSSAETAAPWPTSSSSPGSRLWASWRSTSRRPEPPQLRAMPSLPPGLRATDRTPPDAQ
jgi:hypothetical protein